MSKNKEKQNNYAFIDSQNLNLAVWDCGWNLDFRKFYVSLQRKYGVKEAFYFIGYIPENRKLYQYLRKIGYKLIFKPVLGKNKDFTKGNVDAELVLHAIEKIQQISFLWLRNFHFPTIRKPKGFLCK